VTGLQI